MIQRGLARVTFRNKRRDVRIDMWPPNIASQSCLTFQNADVSFMSQSYNGATQAVWNK